MLPLLRLWPLLRDDHLAFVLVGPGTAFLFFDGVALGSLSGIFPSSVDHHHNLFVLVGLIRLHLVIVRIIVL
jgi:hypothetical protein